MEVKLSRSQYQYYASAFKTLAEGIILGSSAAFFLPEALQMEQGISISRFINFFTLGSLFLIVGGIMSTRGKV